VSQTPVHWAVLAPASWISPLAAAGIEAAGTFVQLLVVFMLLANRRYHQWAPVAAGVMLTASIIALASLSGAAFSPARALGPDVLAGEYPMLWIYFSGPAVGSSAAAAAVWFSGQRPVTGKLFHDPAIEYHMRCAFPGPVGTSPSADKASGTVA
jgi:glycerol uptake facilitator-like aquaporin